MTDETPINTANPIKIIDSLPNLRKAALAIAYDNSKINRFEPEASFLEEVEDLISELTLDDLRKIDKALGDLSEEFQTVLTTGEHSEVEAVTHYLNTQNADTIIGPDFLKLGDAINGLLNDIFELPGKLSDPQRIAESRPCRFSPGDVVRHGWWPKNTTRTVVGSTLIAPDPENPVYSVTVNETVHYTYLEGSQTISDFDDQWMESGLILVKRHDDITFHGHKGT